MKKRPYSIKTTVERVTPQKATDWLNSNTHNRTPRAATVDHYSRVMTLGRWELTPHGIIFAKDGTLVDGQHRLLAIVQANTPVWMTVSRLSADHDDVMPHIDRGVGRTIGDDLKLLHGVKAPARVAAVCRAIAQIALNAVPRKMTTADTTAILEIYSREIEPSVALAAPMPALFPSPVIAVFCVALPVHRTNVTRDLKSLLHGSNLDPGSPMLTLRNWLLMGAHRSAHTCVRTDMLMNATGLAIRNSLTDKTVTRQRIGSQGLDWLRANQAETMLKVQHALGMAPLTNP